MMKLNIQMFAEQTILNNVKSTGGSPYAYYTITATPSNRKLDSVDITIKATGKLASSSSFLGKSGTMGLRVYPTFAGKESSDYIELKATDTSWSGTTSHSVSKKYTITGLSVLQTSISNIKVRVSRTGSASDDYSQGASLKSTSCSNISIESASAPSVLNSITSPFKINGSFTPSITKYSSSFYDIMYVKLGNTTIKTIEDVKSGSTYSFTEEEKELLYSLFATDTSKTLSFSINTYVDNNKSTLLGTSSKDAICNLNSSYLLSITNEFNIIDSFIIKINNDGLYDILTIKDSSGNLIKTIEDVKSDTQYSFTEAEKNIIYSKIGTSSYMNLYFYLTAKSASDGYSVGSTQSLTSKCNLNVSSLNDALITIENDGTTKITPNIVNQGLYDILNIKYKNTIIKTINDVKNNITYQFTNEEKNTLISQFENNSSISLTLELSYKSASNGYQVGSPKSISKICYLPDYSLVLTASFSDTSEYDKYILNKNKLIRYLSKPKMVFSAESSTNNCYGNTISYYVNNEVKTSPYQLNNYNGNNYTIKASDGRKTAINNLITTENLINYQYPSIKSVKVTRPSATGGNIEVEICGNYHEDLVNLKNLENTVLKFWYQEKDDTSSYQIVNDFEITTSKDESTNIVSFTATKTFNKNGNEFNYKKSVDFKVEFSDKLNVSIEAISGTLKKGQPAWNAYSNSDDDNVMVINGLLNVKDKTTINDSATLNGKTIVNNSAELNGKVTINNTLDVSGNSTLSGATSINNTLDVSGKTTLNGTTVINEKLNVTGETTFGSNVKVTGNINSDSITSSSIIANGDIKATGQIKMNDNYCLGFSMVGTYEET